MISTVQRKTTIGLVTVVMIVFMYDVVLDLLDSLFSFVSMLFEWVEYVFDSIISGLFETGHHETELITFYLLLSIGGYLCFRLVRALPRLYRQFKRNQRAAWLRQKRRTTFYWRHLSIFKKIKLFGITSIGFTCLLFLI